MAKAMATAVTIAVPKASLIFGKMAFLEVNEVENPNTHEKTQKVGFLSNKLRDVFEITIPSEVDLSALSEGSFIDFNNVEVTFRATARNAFGNAVPWLGISGKAESVHDIDKIPNKATNPKESKS